MAEETIWCTSNFVQMADRNTGLVVQVPTILFDQPVFVVAYLCKSWIHECGRTTDLIVYCIVVDMCRCVRMPWPWVHCIPSGMCQEYYGICSCQVETRNGCVRHRSV